MNFLYGEKLKYKLAFIDALEQENIVLKNDVNFLRQQLEEVNLERKRLNDLILKKAGFIVEESYKELTSKEFKPIGSTRSSWPRQRAALELESLKRSKTNSLVKPMTDEEIKVVDDLIKKGEEQSES